MTRFFTTVHPLTLLTLAATARANLPALTLTVLTLFVVSVAVQYGQPHALPLACWTLHTVRNAIEGYARAHPPFSAGDLVVWTRPGAQYTGLLVVREVGWLPGARDGYVHCSRVGDTESAALLTDGGAWSSFALAYPQRRRSTVQAGYASAWRAADSLAGRWRSLVGLARLWSRLVAEATWGRVSARYRQAHPPFAVGELVTWREPDGQGEENALLVVRSLSWSPRRRLYVVTCADGPREPIIAGGIASAFRRVRW